MEAIILAGGFGTRLHKEVPNWPKPMAPVAGKPFLEILLDLLVKQGIDNIVLSLGYMADKVVDHFGSSWRDATVKYVVESTPLGTGGAVRLAMTACESDHVFVFNGDTYLDIKISDLEAHWQTTRHPIIVGREVSDSGRYGRLVATENRVCGFAEKRTDKPGLINAGCYVFNSGQLDSFPLNTAFSLEADYLAAAVKQTTFDLFVTDGQFIDIGVPEDYRRASDLLRNHIDLK